MKRKTYLDNIRWATVVLVLIYHVFYYFNAQGVFGGFGPFTQVQYQDVILYFVYPWFMALLFVIAGISARYSLQKRSGKEFFKDRTVKLLVPSTLGLFVFYWIAGYFNVWVGGGWEQMPAELPGFVRYLISVASGIGPLWFAQMLWLFSGLLLLLRKLDRKDALFSCFRNMNAWGVLVFLPLIWASAQVLNTPVITVYRFGIYFTAYLLGYYVFSHEKLQNSLAQNAVPLCTAAAILGIVYTWYYFGTNYAEDECLKSVFTAVYLWIAVLAILGAGKRWLDAQSKLCSFMTRQSSGIYMLHCPVMAFTCWTLRFVLHLPAAMVYILGIVLSFLLTVGLNELLSRIPFLRFCVLGVRKKQ
ncbi:MAG: acyltransferase family protein [Faecousia sp.]